MVGDEGLEVEVMDVMDVVDCGFTVDLTRLTVDTPEAQDEHADAGRLGMERLPRSTSRCCTYPADDRSLWLVFTVDRRIWFKYGVER